MAADTNVNININGEDRSKGAITSARSGLQGFGGTVKQLGVIMAGVFATKQILDFGVSSVKAFSEAQAATTRMNQTLENASKKMYQTTLATKDVATAMKVTGVEADKMRNAIKEAELAIGRKELNLKKLKDQLDKGKISTAEYNQSLKETKNEIEGLQIKITDYNAKLGEKDTKTISITRSVKGFGMSLEEMKKKVEAASQAVIKLGFDDEDAAESLAKFVSVTGNFTEAQKMMNLAMDLARAKNIDLMQASQLLVQVFAGNTRVLKSFGIEIDENATKAQIFGKIFDEVGGTAQKRAEDFDIKMQALNITFQNLKEGIGGTLVESLLPFMESLQKFADDPRFVEAVQQITKVIAFGLNIALLGVVGTLTFFYLGLKGIWDAGKAVVGFFQGIFTDFMRGLRMTIQDVANVVNSLANGLERIINLASSVKNTVVGAVKGAASAVGISVAGKRAAGGPVLGGSSYLVGENGPELFTPAFAGAITPNRALVGFGNITINVTGNQLLSQDAGEVLAEQIMRALKREHRI